MKTTQTTHEKVEQPFPFQVRFRLDQKEIYIQTE